MGGRRDGWEATMTLRGGGAVGNRLEMHAGFIFVVHSATATAIQDRYSNMTARELHVDNFITFSQAL